MRKYLPALFVAVGLLVLMAACQPATPAEPQTVQVEVTRVVEVTKEVPVEKIVEVTPAPAWEIANQNLATSLHHTTQGMRYYYQKEQGGFETLTGVSYEDLGCKNCHVPVENGQAKCDTCHITEAVDAPPQFKCTGCHGRQNFEIVAKRPDGTKGINDVHYAKGMQCINCHSDEAVHGDGMAYNSLLESPAASKCTDCHQTTEKKEWADMQAHQVHAENMDCAACHVQQVNSCFNCHFDTEVNEKFKIEYRKYYDWKFLMLNDEGKITTATIMPMVYQDDKSFAVLAPYYGHSIQRPNPETVCNDCHKNANVAAYNETGKIQISKWNEGTNSLDFATGVIPVPPDYDIAFIIDFVTRDGTAWNEQKNNWKFMETGPDMWQILFGKPLVKMPTQFP
ncbi:MAG: cytochrome c3 family protein [Anaerolineales bacterium]|nr:cytochrome c3 family protein [Anaerolineales bacterium]NUQ83188.1 hypothetical protein [Anaerolineales bacterium]